MQCRLKPDPSLELQDRYVFVVIVISRSVLLQAVGGLYGHCTSYAPYFEV